MKRLLALDGGGIRGVLTIQILVEIEKQLREVYGRPDLVLADHFDYVGGTSTGAIIGSLISWGAEMEEIRNHYLEQSKAMFCPQKWYRRFMTKFHSQGLTDFFQSFFVEEDGSLATLGTEKLKTRLLIVTRNAMTGSPWPLTNNPAAKYNQRGATGCNLELPLWQLVRASTAAPTFFPPEVVTIYDHAKPEAPGVECAFEDGGVTPYNNPAYLLYLKATLPEYHTAWPEGVDQLSLVSVGTGRIPGGRIKRDLNLLEAASTIPDSLISSFVSYQDLLCRHQGLCRFGGDVDSEVGNLVRPNPEARFGYCRYDVPFSKAEVERVKRESKGGFSLDNLSLIPYFLKVGEAFAIENIKLRDFAPELL